MNTQTHTPGPWAVRHTDNGLRIVYSDGELRSHVADLHSMSLCDEHGSLRANASLIAASPDMFDALRAIVDAFGDQDSLLIDQCKAALAKATA